MPLKSLEFQTQFEQQAILNKFSTKNRVRATKQKTILSDFSVKNWVWVALWSKIILTNVKILGDIIRLRIEFEWLFRHKFDTKSNSCLFEQKLSLSDISITNRISVTFWRAIERLINKSKEYQFITSYSLSLRMVCS